MLFFFFFNDPAPSEIYTLSLHDALPISLGFAYHEVGRLEESRRLSERSLQQYPGNARSEEHTSELQSHHDLVCRLLLEKKNNSNKSDTLTGTRSAYRPRSHQLRSRTPRL